MTEFYNERIVSKPQKVHTCEGCCKKMQVDRKHYYVSCKWEGEFSTARLCFACKKHLIKYSSNYSYDGWGTGDLGEGRKEIVRDWQYKRLNKNEATQP